MSFKDLEEAGPRMNHVVLVDPLIRVESCTVHVKGSHLDSIRFRRRMILEELVDLEDPTSCIITIEAGDIEFHVGFKEGGRL